MRGAPGGALSRGCRGAPPVGIDQRLDALPNVIADLSNLVDRPSLRIPERPIVAPKAGHVRTLVTTPHRDQQGGVAQEIVAQALRARTAQIDPDFPHHVDDLGMHPFGRLRTGRDGVGERRVRDRGEERGRHLRAAGIVDTGEHHALH